MRPVRAGPPAEGLHLRPARPDEIPCLDALALAAKASWGYSALQMDLWRDEMALRLEAWPARPVCVATRNGQVLGYVQLATDTEPWSIWGLWVLPAVMGQGVGRQLFEWALDRAAAAGQATIAIDADPNAEGFYRACGAERVGRLASPIAGQTDRHRPQMRCATARPQDRTCVASGKPAGRRPRREPPSD